MLHKIKFQIIFTTCHYKREQKKSKKQTKQNKTNKRTKNKKHSEPLIAPLEEVVKI